MNSYDQNFVSKLTRAGEEARRKLLSYYARLPEQVKMEVHRMQTELMRQNRNQSARDKQTEFVFACFVLAIRKIERLENGQTGKRELSTEDAKKITELRVERVKSNRKKKASPVKQLIEIRFYEEIKKLRGEGLSWREISTYIAKHHKRRISHAYIQQTFTDLTRNRVGGLEEQQSPRKC